MCGARCLCMGTTTWQSRCDGCGHSCNCIVGAASATAAQPGHTIEHVMGSVHLPPQGASTCGGSLFWLQSAAEGNIMRRCVAAVRIVIGPTGVCISSMLCSSCLGLKTWLFQLHFILGSCAELVHHGRRFTRPCVDSTGTGRASCRRYCSAWHHAKVLFFNHSVGFTFGSEGLPRWQQLNWLQRCGSTLSEMPALQQCIDKSVRQVLSAQQIGTPACLTTT